jgi:hypothetical protein
MIINKDLFLLYPVTIQYVPVPAGRLNNFFVIMLKIVTFIHEKTPRSLLFVFVTMIKIKNDSLYIKHQSLTHSITDKIIKHIKIKDG